MNVRILGRLRESGLLLPFYSFKFPARFPNPAAVRIEQDFSLDRLLDVRAPHIYVAQIDGDSMIGIRTFDANLIGVDRSHVIDRDDMSDMLELADAALAYAIEIQIGF